MDRKRSILITGFVSTLVLPYLLRSTVLTVQSRCSLGGAGHSLALEFAARGMRVFATARSTKNLSALEEKGIEVYALDVTNADSIAALKEEIVKRTGGTLDILFNNAGTSMSYSNSDLGEMFRPQKYSYTSLNKH